MVTTMTSMVAPKMSDEELIILLIHKKREYIHNLKYFSWEELTHLVKCIDYLQRILEDRRIDRTFFSIYRALYQKR
jgi:hypothetical protein